MQLFEYRTCGFCIVGIQMGAWTTRGLLAGLLAGGVTNIGARKRLDPTIGTFAKEHRFSMISSFAHYCVFSPIEGRVSVQDSA